MSKSFKFPYLIIVTKEQKKLIDADPNFTKGWDKEYKEEFDKRLLKVQGLLKTAIAVEKINGKENK